MIVRKNFGRLAIGAAIAAATLAGGSALALPGLATSKDTGGVCAGDDGPVSTGNITRTVNALVGTIVKQGGGVSDQDPTHGVPAVDAPRPTSYINGGIQTVASTLDQVALGLSGVHVGPIPPPAPGIHPESYANKGIQTVASTLDQVALGLGGVHVGPIPQPAPGILPLPEL